MKRILTILIAAVAVIAIAEERYTVTVLGQYADDDLKPVWTETNCISVVHHTPDCWFIKYLSDGKTNEFHAWLVPVKVETNKPALRVDTTNGIGPVTKTAMLEIGGKITNTWLGLIVQTNDYLLAHYTQSPIAGKSNFINQLVTSGEFCRVRGHVWQEEIEYEWIDSANVSYPEMKLPAIITNPKIATTSPVKHRKCSVCELVQTKQPGEWK